MNLFAVKNDKGKWLGCEIYCDEPDWFNHGGFMFDSMDKAETDAQIYGGHVVELVEALEKVVVNEDEAEMLEQATCDDDPAELIVGFVNSRYKYDEDGDAEDRLMRAYVIGWEVEKPKRYVLPMPGTDYHNIQMHGNAQYYAIKGTGNWRPDAIALGTDDAVKHGYTVTQSDIDAAPKWVQILERVEVTDDGMGC